jgi:hypothetical protein
MPDPAEPKIRRPRKTLQEREAALQADLERVREQQALASKTAIQGLAQSAQTFATKFSGQPHAKLIAQAAQLLTQASNEIRLPKVQ